MQEPPKHELPMLHDDELVHAVRHTLSVGSAVSAQSAAFASADAHVADALAFRQSDALEQGRVQVPQMHFSVPPHDVSSRHIASHWFRLPVSMGLGESSQAGATSIGTATSGQNLRGVVIRRFPPLPSEERHCTPRRDPFSGLV
jgi:hypothetical protein